MLAPPTVLLGLWPNPIAYTHPHPGAAARRGVRSSELGARQVGYAVVCPIVLLRRVGCPGGKAEPYVVQRSGVRRYRAAPQALVRTTTFEPRSALWCMLVIWTPVALLRRFVLTLARRYGPGQCTHDPHRVLLLTSIIVANCLVLNDTPGGHDDGLPRLPLVFRLSCGHRDDHHLRLRDTMSAGSSTGPVPVIGLVAETVGGGHAAVRWRTYRFRAWRWSRALGMLTGLPCLPWFIGVRRLTVLGCQERRFASDHGTWWPYLVEIAVCNLAIVWVPRFRASPTRNWRTMPPTGGGAAGSTAAETQCRLNRDGCPVPSMATTPTGRRIGAWRQCRGGRGPASRRPVRSRWASWRRKVFR